MRLLVPTFALISIVTFVGVVQVSAQQQPPAPTTPGGKCAKEIGGTYQWDKKRWWAGNDPAWQACMKRHGWKT